MARLICVEGQRSLPPCGEARRRAPVRAVEPNTRVLAESQLLRRERKKLQKTSVVFERSLWSVDDFSTRLGVENAGIDARKEINSDIVSHEQLLSVFGTRQANGWKPKVNEHLTQEECDELFKMHTTVYAHPPANGDYPAIFLRGWLAHRNGNHVNWARYAYDCTQEQFKRAGRPTLATRRRTTVSTASQQSSQGEEVPGHSQNADDSNCVVTHSIKPLKIFLPNQISSVKLILEDAQNKKLSIQPKITTMKSEKEILHASAQEKRANLQDRRKSHEQERCKLECLQCSVQKLRSEVALLQTSIPQADSSPIDSDRTLLLILDELKRVVEECDFTQKLLKREADRVLDCEKELVEVEDKVEVYVNELEALDIQFVQSKIWIHGLGNQIEMMSSGSGLSTYPLPTLNPVNLPTSFSALIQVTNCPICGYSFGCNNIAVTSCGCTYHPFCLAVLVDSDTEKCSRPACGRLFSKDWLASFGFNQINAPWRIPKKENGIRTRLRSASRSEQSSHDGNYVGEVGPELSDLFDKNLARQNVGSWLHHQHISPTSTTKVGESSADEQVNNSVVMMKTVNNNEHDVTAPTMSPELIPIKPCTIHPIALDTVAEKNILESITVPSSNVNLLETSFSIGSPSVCLPTAIPPFKKPRIDVPPEGVTLKEKDVNKHRTQPTDMTNESPSQKEIMPGDDVRVKAGRKKSQPQLKNIHYLEAYLKSKGRQIVTRGMKT